MNSRENILGYIFYFYSIVVAFLLACFNKNFMIDDEYILFKYADNLVHMGEWTFNGIEKANGSTSILYVLLLALGPILGQNVESFSFVLNVCIWGIWGGLTFYLLYILTEKRWLGFLGTLFIITVPYFVTVFRMESHLVLVLQIAVLIFMHRKQYNLMGFFGGLAYLARPDSLIFIGIIGLYFILFKKNETPWKSLLSFALVVVPWWIYSVLNFGTIFPGTLSAKIGQAESGFWGTLFLGGMLDHIKRFYQQEPATLFLLSFIFILGLMSTVLKIKFDKGQIKVVKIIILIYIILYVIVYGLIFGVPNYHWYYTPVFYYSLIVIITLASNIDYYGKKHFILVIMLIMFTQNYQYNMPLRFQSIEPGATRKDYKVIGEYIKDNIPIKSTIAAYEVGILSWYSERPIVDILGLNNKRFADYITNRDVGLWLIDSEPDYILINNPTTIFQRATPYQDWDLVPWFRNAYLPLKKFSLEGREYVLYNKVMDPTESRNRFNISTLAFPLDYENDQSVLGVSKLWKDKIMNARTLEMLEVRSVSNVESKLENTFLSKNGDPMLEISVPKIKNDEAKRFFLRVKMRTKALNKHLGYDVMGQLFLATDSSPIYSEESSAVFRVFLDNKYHQYYIPLNVDNEWLSLEDIKSIRFDPVSDVLCQFEIKSIELASV